MNNIIFIIISILNTLAAIFFRWIAQVYKNSHKDPNLFLMCFYFIIGIQLVVMFYDTKSKRWPRVIFGILVLLILFLVNIFDERTVAARLR